MTPYPSDAHSPSGEPWWQLRIWPGKKKAKFGGEPKIAAWLMFNTKVGGIFTLKYLREALGGIGEPNDDEHLNRRLRKLRDYGWTVHSGRDDANLKQDEYRLAIVGKPIWLGKAQFTKKTVSNKIRRQIIDRDGHRCVICGVGAGESYPGERGTRARLTVGHFVADSLRGPNYPANLRTECSRCNEPAKEESARSESAEELWPRIRGLGRADKARLLAWAENGQRDRDDVDRLFDQYRCLPAAQRDELRMKLAQAVKGADPAP
jgi:5-methylcytosine-specific restriction endonuclease McrA